MPQFQELFWYDVIPDVCKQIISHISYAKKILHKTYIIKEPALFENFLLPVQQSAEKAIEEQKRVIGFLKTYEKPTS